MFLFFLREEVFTKMSKNKKSKFWIPTAISVAAFLVAVSMIATKSVTGNFATANDNSIVVNSIHAHDDGDSNDGQPGGGDSNDGQPGGGDSNDGQPGDGENNDGTQESEQIPDDIAEHPVASFAVKSSFSPYAAGEVENEQVTLYYKIGDGEITLYTDSDQPIQADNATVTLYAKETIKHFVLRSGDVTSADFSKLTELVSLRIDKNSLTKVELNKNTKLQNLIIFDNKIAAPDLSKNTALTELTIDGCEIASINLSGNTNLQVVDLSFNLLKTVDFSKNTKLEFLDISNNKLTSLDLSKQPDLTGLFFQDNQITSFNSVKVASTKLNEPNGEQLIPNLPEKVKAGEKLDLSALNKYGKTKSYYEFIQQVFYPGMKDVIPETDKDLVFVFGNAYAGEVVTLGIYNADSLVSFIGTFEIEENPNAPAAPEAPKGDVPVDDVSGTIKEANAADKFDAQLITYDESTKKFSLGEKVSKEDLTLSITKIANATPYYDAIAKEYKTFNKDTARLLVYNISLDCNGDYSYIKLTGGMNLTLSYPSDIAKTWDKYNFKVYHFADFNYDTLEELKPEKVEPVTAKCDKNGIHLTGKSFSIYAISITPKSGGTESPGTGESSVSSNIAILFALFAIAGVAAVVAKLKGERKIQREMEQL